MQYTFTHINNDKKQHSMGLTDPDFAFPEKNKLSHSWMQYEKKQVNMKPKEEQTISLIQVWQCCIMTWLHYVPKKWFAINTKARIIKRNTCKDQQITHQITTAHFHMFKYSTWINIFQKTCNKTIWTNMIEMSWVRYQSKTFLDLRTIKNNHLVIYLHTHISLVSDL